MLNFISRFVFVPFVCSIFLMGCKPEPSPTKDKELSGDKALSISLNNVIDEIRSSPFACSFGHFKVEMVDSKYKDHKYFKVSGKGVLINSGWIHTEVGSNSDIIYAVPLDSPIRQGTNLTGYCITTKKVPYEGRERQESDKAAAVVDFALVEP